MTENQYTDNTHPARGHIEVATSTCSPPLRLVEAAGAHSTVVSMRVYQDHCEELGQRRRLLTEILMSPAQWAQLASRTGTEGYGRAVTLNRVLGQKLPEYEPEASQIETAIEELRSHYETSMARVNEAVAELERGVESKAGVKELRAALARVKSETENMPANGAYAAATVERIANAVAIERDFAAGLNDTGH